MPALCKLHSIVKMRVVVHPSFLPPPTPKKEEIRVRLEYGVTT